MRVTKHEGPDGVQDGYILDIVRDGRSISQIGVLFDGEVSQIERFCAAADGAATIATAARIWTHGIVPLQPVARRRCRSSLRSRQCTHSLPVLAGDGEARVGGPWRGRVSHPGGQGLRDQGQAPHHQARTRLFSFSVLRAAPS